MAGIDVNVISACIQCGQPILAGEVFTLPEIGRACHRECYAMWLLKNTTVGIGYATDIHNVMMREFSRRERRKV